MRWLLVLLLPFLHLLVACHRIGNGEGYPGAVSEQKIADGIYYWLEEGYECRPGVGSYRDAIQVRGGTRTRLGDRCAPTKIEIPKSVALEYFESAGLIGYGDGMYEKTAHGIAPLPGIEAWCRDEAGKVEIAARAADVTLSTGGKVRKIAVARSEDAAEVEYAGDDFALRVARAQTVKVAGGVTIGGVATTLACRHR